MKPKNIILIAVISFFSLSTYAQSDVVDIILLSEDHTTFITTIKAAGLVSTLKKSGPYTIFAPTNEAFDKLPPKQLANLLNPENKATLASILSYHVIAGSLTETEIINKINVENGSFTLQTVNGQQLVATLKDNKIAITDTTGHTSLLTKTDINGKNGIIHVADTVLSPSN
ncbi:fasciclin domain-containing protein [Dokdonia sp. PRO95]|uniref:fasciclin domain-containing protein n=1 Tax=Dokdonia sp. PRO95 TaxID=1239415 RepID=UPI0005588CF4|nr:fasciclin domain-containing protein [Dokdonia sp. PRO95]